MKLDVLIKVMLLLFIFNGCSFSQKAQIQHSEIHFTLDKIGLESPVELIFYAGKYHLFYQFVKDMQVNWGQAVSENLINWENITTGIKFDALSGLGSGSIIVDWTNVLGTGDGLLLAFYTREYMQNQKPYQNGQTISIAYSSDGITWKPYENTNVLLESCPEIKDIDIFWHENTQRWIMLVLSVYDLRVYSSVDLINWGYESMVEAHEYLESDAGKNIEFFPVEVDETRELKWVLLISVNAGSPNQSGGIQYFIGDFDGYSFNCQDRRPNWLDSGSDNYAGVCLSNYQEYGKPLYYLGLIYSSRYENYNEDILDKNYYTIPRAFSVIKKHDYFYLLSNPLKELESSKKLIKATSLSGKLELKNKITSPQEINLSFNVSNKLHFEFPESFGIQLSNNNNAGILTIGYYSKENYFFISEQDIDKDIDNIRFSRYLIDKPLMDIKIIVDNPIVEMFAMDGSIVLTQKLHTSGQWNKKILFTEKGNVRLNGGSLKQLGNN